uniref:Uncharacterized protein n=1 Tax=Anguilla anguilla TaxID=7936 RepID=A0A0E9RL60_ANGAN
MLVEKKNHPSVPAADSSNDVSMPFVVNDIATFFTLLVGIYFPSVTGENTPCAMYLHICGSVLLCDYVKRQGLFLSFGSETLHG